MEDTAEGEGQELGRGREAGDNDLRTDLIELQFLCKQGFIFPIITS